MKIIKYYYQLRKIDEFHGELQKFCTMEDEAKKIYYKKYYDHMDFPQPREIQSTVQHICNEKYNNTYQLSRSKLAQLIPSIQKFGNELGINTERVARAPATAGGLIYSIDIFNSLLEQAGYIELESSVVFDAVDKMKGILKEKIKMEWVNISNPLTWLSYALKIPFLLIKQTGFNVDTIENALWGKLIKLVCVFLLLWTLLRLGFKQEQIVSFFKF